MIHRLTLCWYSYIKHTTLLISGIYIKVHTYQPLQIICYRCTTIIRSLPQVMYSNVCRLIHYLVWWCIAVGWTVVVKELASFFFFFSFMKIKVFQSDYMSAEWCSSAWQTQKTLCVHCVVAGNTVVPQQVPLNLEFMNRVWLEVPSDCIIGGNYFTLQVQWQPCQPGE